MLFTDLRPSDLCWCLLMSERQKRERRIKERSHSSGYKKKEFLMCNKNILFEYITGISFIQMLQKEHTTSFLCKKGTKKGHPKHKDRKKTGKTNRKPNMSEHQNKEAAANCLVVPYYSFCTCVYTHTEARSPSTHHLQHLSLQDTKIILL